MNVGIALNVRERARLIGGAAHAIVAAISNSRINYYAAYAIDFSCPFLFAFLGTRYTSSWAAIVVSSVFGLILYSLIEYSTHRWMLHNPRSALFYLHDAHHDTPAQTSAFIFPTSLLILMPLWWFLTVELRIEPAAYFLMGLSSGYLYFGTLHHLMHRTRVNQIPFRWLKQQWAFHTVHHRLDDRNYGVISPVWDYVFGTHQKQIKRRQS